MAFKSLELLAATKIRSNSAQKLDASLDCYLLLGCHTQIAKNLPMIFKRFQKSKTSNNSFPSSSIFLDHLEPQSLQRELTCLFAVFWTLQQNSMVPEPSWAQNHPGEVEQRSRWTHLCLFRTACLPWIFVAGLWAPPKDVDCLIISAWTLVNHGTCTLSAGPTGIAQRRRSNRKVVPQNHSSLKFSAPKHIASGPKQKGVVNSRMKHPINQSFGGHLPYYWSTYWSLPATYEELDRTSHLCLAAEPRLEKRWRFAGLRFARRRIECIHRDEANALHIVLYISIHSIHLWSFIISSTWWWYLIHFSWDFVFYKYFEIFRMWYVDVASSKIRQKSNSSMLGDCLSRSGDPFWRIVVPETSKNHQRTSSKAEDWICPIIPIITWRIVKESSLPRRSNSRVFMFVAGMRFFLKPSGVMANMACNGQSPSDFDFFMTPEGGFSDFPILRPPFTLW